MPTRFEKTDDRFDGFDPKTVYQMVPVSGTRPMTLITEADECTMVVDPPGIAKMQNFVFSTPLRESPDKYRAHVTRGNRVTFDILGERKGNTTIFLLDRKDDVFGTLLVSVKEKISKTVALCLLSDRKRNCPFNAAELPGLLTMTASVFRQQANIELTSVGPVFSVNVPEDLGDPLTPDKPGIKRSILLATPTAARLADFCVFYTWNITSISRPDIRGLNMGFDCYVEKQVFSPKGINEEAITTAHEIGHGLGLQHTGAQKLMAGDGNMRSSKLQQFEIDTINTTDE